MKKMFIAVLTAADLLFCGLMYGNAVRENLSDNLLRLHVIANSDSKYDQDIKLMVRDEILKEIKSKDIKSKNDVMENFKNIEFKINSLLNKNNIDYGCKIFYTISDFPKKEYLNISLPSGRYECIKAVLGEGKGKNWWCVAYPPLCFSQSVTGKIDKNGYEYLKDNIDEEALDVITRKNREFKIKFMVVDSVNKLIEYLK